MLRPFDFVRVKPSYFESQPPPMSLPLSFGVHTAGELKEKEAARERLDKNDRENIGIVTETNGREASVTWLLKETSLHTAWWDESALEVVNNLTVLIADGLAHPFGHHTDQGEKFYGLKEEEQ